MSPTWTPAFSAGLLLATTAMRSLPSLSSLTFILQGDQLAVAASF